MSQWNFRLDPAQPEAFQRQLVKEGRSGSERMHSRAPVMNKARESQFGRTRAAADTSVCFTKRHRAACARESDCRSQAIWAGADDNSVVFHLICQRFAQRQSAANFDCA